MKLKRVFGVGIAIALMTPIGVLAAQPAGAAPIVTCAKPSGKLPLSPPLDSTKKQIITIKINLPIKGCKGGGVTSGISTGQSKTSKPVNCAEFLSNPSNTSLTTTITWNTKKTSVYKATTTSKVVNGAIVATLTGKITKGIFLGKKVATTVKVTFDGNCSPGHPMKAIIITGQKPFTIT
jgi:hypothetical protein